MLRAGSLPVMSHKDYAMRCRTKTLTAIAVSSLLYATPNVTSCLAHEKSTMPATDGTFTWTNPLSPNVRDPQVLKIDGTYYMTGTAAPFFESLGQTPGVKVWRSADLVHWDDGTVVLAPSETGWYKIRFWAPEIYHHRINDGGDGKFYLAFNCPDGPDAKKATQAIGLAVADRVMGPYRVLTENKPLAPGNDAHVFRDTDGKTYIFRSGLDAFEVDLPNAKVIGKPFDVLAKGPKGAWDGRSDDAPAVGLEGPWVIKIEKTYYCFYSSWGRGYEVGYATADNVRGPWTRYAHNPIYGAQDEQWCKKYKHDYTGDPTSPYRQVGHNALFTGPDGRLWHSAHAYRKGDKVLQPHLVIDPLRFENGEFKPSPPSYTEQSVKVGK